jgi:hypothetical protein
MAKVQREAKSAVPDLDERKVKSLICRRESLPKRGTAGFMDPSMASARFGIRQRYSERLVSALGCSFDSEGVEGIRLQCQNEMRQAIQQHKAKAVRESAETQQALHREIATWRRYHDQAGRLSPSPAFNFNFVVLDTPGFIYATPGLALAGISPAPWNNAVKFTGNWASPYPDNGGDGLFYVFAWRNPRSDTVVVNVASYFTLNGFCDADAGYGLNNTGIAFNPFLHLYEWWNDPPTEPPFQDGQLNHDAPFLSADGGGPFGVGDYESMQVGGSYDMTYNNLMIPGNAVAVFYVTLGVDHGIVYDGYIDVDFASGDFQAVCPALILAILN